MYRMDEIIKRNKSNEGVAEREYFASGYTVKLGSCLEAVVQCKDRDGKVDDIKFKELVEMIERGEVYIDGINHLNMLLVRNEVLTQIAEQDMGLNEKKDLMKLVIQDAQGYLNMVEMCGNETAQSDRYLEAVRDNVIRVSLCTKGCLGVIDEVIEALKKQNE